MAIGCILGKSSQIGGGTPNENMISCLDPMIMLGESSILCDSDATSSDKNRSTYLAYTDDYIFMMRTDTGSSSKTGLFKIVRMDNGKILANDISYTGATCSNKPYCGTYNVANALILFGCHTDSASNSDTIKIFDINKDDDTYTQTDYACPRKLNGGTAIIRQGNSFYLIGTDNGTANTYKDIVRFDYPSKSFTVCGQTIANLTFGAVNSGICWNDDKLIVHGKRIDDNVEMIVLWTPATGYFEDVTTEPEYAHVLAFFNSEFFGYGENREPANIQNLNGLYIKTNTNLYTRTYVSSYSTSFNNICLSEQKGICLDTINKKAFIFTFPQIVYGDRSVGRYSIFVIKDNFWVTQCSGTSGDYTLGPLKALGKAKVNTNILRGIGVDVAKINSLKPPQRSLSCQYTEKVFYIPGGCSIKVRTDYPEPIYINIMRDGDYKSLNLLPDENGFYEINQPCYIYACIACPYVKLPGASSPDMYNWYNNPFVLLIK